MQYSQLGAAVRTLYCLDNLGRTHYAAVPQDMRNLIFAHLCPEQLGDLLSDFEREFIRKYMSITHIVGQRNYLGDVIPPYYTQTITAQFLVDFPHARPVMLEDHLIGFFSKMIFIYCHGYILVCTPGHVDLHYHGRGEIIPNGRYVQISEYMGASYVPGIGLHPTVNINIYTGEVVQSGAQISHTPPPPRSVGCGLYVTKFSDNYMLSTAYRSKLYECALPSCPPLDTFQYSSWQ